MSTVSPAAFDLDDVLGSDSPLDRPLTFTVFADELARNSTEQNITLRDLARRVHSQTAPSKAQLPLLKLATFGNVATTKGSLRHNANVLAIDGIEGDYDGERVSIDDAGARLEAAGIAALLYSSPSHTPDKPRWRVLCPLSAPAPPAEREHLCARLNGALGGLLSGESFTLSQSYYFGRVADAPALEVAIVDGRPLDAASELSVSALGRRGEPYTPGPELVAPLASANDDDDDDWDWQAPPDWDRIESALAAIPVTDADHAETGGRDLWRDVGLALHDASGGSDDGFARWDAWSRDGEKYDGRVQRSQWASFGRSKSPKRIKVATLFHTAKRYGWNPKAPALAVADPIDGIGEGAAPETPVRAATVLRFLSPADCATAPARQYLIKGLLARGDLACIFGAPGAGKSLLSPHFGYHVAQGRSVFGMRSKPGRVLYVAAEDPHGMRARIYALKLRHGDAPDFILIEGVSDLFDRDAPDLVALRNAIADQQPALIFIDTLAMAFPGLEENDAEAMNRVVRIGRQLSEGGAAVVLIHHDTKAQGPTPRGHSALNGALDVALQLFPRDEAGIVRGRLTKNRNGSCDRDFAFRIGVESLGRDEDGDAITAALAEELSPQASAKRAKLSASEREALKVLQALAVAGSADEGDWRDACIKGTKVSAAETPESRRKATARAIQGLTRKGAVWLRSGRATLPDHVEAGGENAFDVDPET